MDVSTLATYQLDPEQIAQVVTTMADSSTHRGEYVRNCITEVATALWFANYATIDGTDDERDAGHQTIVNLADEMAAKIEALIRTY